MSQRVASCPLVSIIAYMSDIPEVLRTLRYALTELLRDQLAGLYLYGSHARGEASDWSDIDVLVVLAGPFDYGDLITQTSPIVAAISLEHDVVISRVFVTQEDFEGSYSPFLRNVRREVVPIAE